MPAKFTNKFNLPSEVFDSIRYDGHITNGDISVTTLIDPPQIKILKKNNTYDIDITDMFAAFLGTALHSLLEKANPNLNVRRIREAAEVFVVLGKKEVANKLFAYANSIAQNDNEICENTISMEIDGTILSGTFDRYIKDLMKLRDYKSTTVNMATNISIIKHWTLQLNTYASMIREMLDLPVMEIEVVVFMKDWTKMKIMSNPSYPKTPIMTIPIKVYDHGKMMDYLKKRVRVHKMADEGTVLGCTTGETWSNAEMFALKLVGGKKALTLFENEKEAEAAKNIKNGRSMETNDKKRYFVEHRKSQPFRCEKYCQVSQFCSQYTKYKEDLLKESTLEPSE